jgi:hypothetical protein
VGALRAEPLAEEALGRPRGEPDRPPGRTTRTSSAAVRAWSGANIAPNTDSTTS